MTKAAKKTTKAKAAAKSPPAAAPRYRDRIVELVRVPASELRENARNWRRHPAHQQNALQAILREVGVANAVIARRADDGVLELVDGHLRREQLGDDTVPVLVLDVTAEEADKLLLTMDPLAAMADKDGDRLARMATSVEFETVELADLIRKLVGKPPEEADAEPKLAGASFQVLIQCGSEEEQADLLERFNGEGLNCRALIC